MKPTDNEEGSIRLLDSNKSPNDIKQNNWMSNDNIKDESKMSLSDDSVSEDEEVNVKNKILKAVLPTLVNKFNWVNT